MKKILCLFTALLVFITSSFASDDLLKYMQKKSAVFQAKQEDYYIKSKNQTDIEKEWAFKKLYANYIHYYLDVIRYYNKNVENPFDNEYVKLYQDEYIKYGFGFIMSEGNWNLETDYLTLINTAEIPDVWSEWLKLQQKYIVKNREACTNRFVRSSRTCEGGTMSVSDMERAIIDLSKIEQKSKVIASIKAQDFEFIPYTSKELIYTYLMGNDLKPIFSYDRNYSSKLNKDSKKSFEHFIRHNKNSKYWEVVNEYYKKLKQNNFVYSAKVNAWLIDELESMR